MEVLTPPAPIIINKKSLHTIHDIACTLTRSSLGKLHVNLILFQALYLFLKRNHITPPFEIAEDIEV